MIKSMTGFASVAADDPSASIAVTIRGVNHRFLDIQLRAPSSLGAIAGSLRSLIQQTIARGRIDLSVSIQSRKQPVVDVEVNEQVIAALSAAFERLRERGLVQAPPDAGDILRFPQAIALRERADEADDASISPAVEAAVAAALQELDRMRGVEGEHLRAELDSRRERVRELFDRAAAAAASGSESLKARLRERIAELQADAAVEPATVAQEIVRFANRSDITEETVRFHAHLEHWRALSDGPEPCGRKLDFLLQEMNREVNTLGAKAEGPGIPELIVSLKAELEKMREQVQNVE
jgi:uncharacterized protein (TIGR00255 family)